MPNYQDGKIYKITGTNDEGNTLIYIGSTTQKLCKRLVGHKQDMKNDRKTSSKQVVICKDCLITLIELFPCNSKEELLMRERYYFDLFDCVNKVRPIQFEGEKQEYFKDYYIENADKLKDYRIENADKIKEYRKQYRIENDDKIKEHKKQYYIKNADKEKERFKQYQIKNADKIKEQRKEYQIKNADKIKEYQKQYRLKNKK